MTKKEFLSSLRSKLQGLPPSDIDERISFYSEMIDDRMDEGKSEEEAVSEIGNVDDVVMDIAKDTPLVKLVKEKMKPKRRIRPWEIVLLVLGFPLWFPLLITFFVLVLVFWIVIWVLAIVTYVLEAALAVKNGYLDLNLLRDKEEEQTTKALMSLYGVGMKVASCVSLFGLHHMDAFPKDVWIKRILANEYPNGYPFTKYSPYNGVYQQYMFAYYRKKERKEP